VVTPWVEQGASRFSGARSFRLSYVTATGTELIPVPDPAVPGIWA
jgi:hypothetical protein